MKRCTPRYAQHLMSFLIMFVSIGPKERESLFPWAAGACLQHYYYTAMEAEKKKQENDRR